MKSRTHHLRPPFKPYVRISRIRLTDGLLTLHTCFRWMDRVPMVVTPSAAGHVTGGSYPAAALGRREEPLLEFSRAFERVVGSCDHALALTSIFSGATKAGSLPSTGFVARRQQYYGPLGLPPGLIPLHRRLIGIALVRRRPPGRVSPVPQQAVSACRPPYPEGVLHPSGTECSLLPSL
jgi:hypothetical protein